MPSTGIRIAFWTIAVLLGGAQTWFTRHRIFSDGISYLEIARQYAGGDWHGALNAYWSPLYSWVIALYLLVFQPSPYWEASALHVINFAAFLGSCWIFEKFLIELTALRPAGVGGFSTNTVFIAGYAAILHGGLVMVGIGYCSPDMIAYFLTGLAAWLILKIALSQSPGLRFAALGTTLGLGYLDRTAFVPVAVLYVLTAAFLLVKNRAEAVRQVALFAICFLLVAAPFAAALTINRGAFTMGESGKLNYGWEVDGAPRSTHWQGEPGDIGKPVHPTRLVLQTPVPVYEFGEPVGGSYPPWHEPSYWYEGIQPHLKVSPQLKVLWMNVRTTVIYLATAPAFVIFFLALVVSRGKGTNPLRWPPVYWVLILPAIAGIAMYCLVFIDKRYIAGFFAVVWITAVAGVAIPRGRLGKYADVAAQTVALLFMVALCVWLRQALTMSIRDAVHGSEGEYNVSWMMARRFAELGVKPGDRIAYIRSGISADWVRIANAKVVVEVPTKYDRGSGILNTVDLNDEYWMRFFRLDQASREKVYDAFRAAGATIAVTSGVPGGGTRGDWTPLLDPADPQYPKTSGQTLEQSPGYYRWLVAPAEARGSK